MATVDERPGFRLTRLGWGATTACHFPAGPQYRDGVDDTEAGIDREIAEMFDPSPDAGSACRVCGALVAPVDEYQRIHWEWHEATNGA